MATNAKTNSVKNPTESSKTKINKTTAKANTKASTTKNNAPTKPEVEVVTEEAVVETRHEPFVPKKVDLHEVVTVRNGFQGMLIYTSKHTGEVWVWDAFGDSQDIEIGELRNARSSNKDFFENNWFMFDDPWVVDFLGVKQYYRNSVSIEEFDDIFSYDEEKLIETLNKMPAGQKKSVAYRASQLISEKKIDSLKTIEILERILGIELIEK